MEYIYAALLLHKLGQNVNEENIKKVVVATGVQADDSKVKSLVASLNGVDIASELANASLAVAAPAASSAAPAQAKAEEEPKKEEKHEAAAAGLSALFG
jgi:large subunit ribosomal protein L12